MRRLTQLTCSLALGGLSTLAGAQNACLNQAQLATTFTGNTLCMSRGTERWQEFHQSGGALIDYKKGSNDPIDPTKLVGTWSITGTGSNAMLVHTYGNSSYSWQVCGVSGGPYTLTGSGGTLTGGTVLAGQHPCP